MKMSHEEYRNARERTDAANGRRKARHQAKGYDQSRYDGNNTDPVEA